MTTKTMDIKDLWVCVDCANVIANGDWSGIDDLTHRAAIEQGLTYSGGHWAILDDVRDFSSKHCDCCKSPLAGSRLEAVLLDVEYETWMSS